MAQENSTFALFFGNRGFFPASLIEQARRDLPKQLAEWGHTTIMLPAGATRHGAIETTREGEVFANFLREKRGQFDGVILSLPNFGDETGAVAALKDAGVPIFIQAYPDQLDQMAPALRRDAFCGKISVMDVFSQYGVKFTVAKPHVVDPCGDAFKANVDFFDRTCRVVKGLKNMVVGAIGARTTPFKTVRVDEVTLQRHGITVETLDLSGIFLRMKDVAASNEAYKDKANVLKNCAAWDRVPDKAFNAIVRLAVVLDEVIDEYQMDAIAIRCWLELQQELGISPCVLLGELNDRGIAAACEVDVANAVAMHALARGAGRAPACLDWNNNYEDQDDKCILFHCGPVPPSLMTAKGTVTDHAILANAVGEGSAYGCNVGRIAATPFTFAGMLTETGKIKFYLGEGRFVEDPVPSDFFGCSGVAEIKNLQDVLLYIGRNGYRHHVSLAPGQVAASIKEAFDNYLGFEVALPQNQRGGI